MLHFSNLITLVSMQLCIDVQIELNINNCLGWWVGEIHFFASVRIRNSASNDKYPFAHAVSRSYNFLVNMVKHEKQNIAHPDTVRNKKS